MPLSSKSSDNHRTLQRRIICYEIFVNMPCYYIRRWTASLVHVKLSCVVLKWKTTGYHLVNVIWRMYLKSLKWQCDPTTKRKTTSEMKQPYGRMSTEREPPPPSATMTHHTLPHHKCGFYYPPHPPHPPQPWNIFGLNIPGVHGFDH